MYIPFKQGDFPAITLFSIGLIFIYFGNNTNSMSITYIGLIEITLSSIQYIVARDYVEDSVNKIRNINK